MRNAMTLNRRKNRLCNRAFKDTRSQVKSSRSCIYDRMTYSLIQAFSQWERSKKRDERDNTQQTFLADQHRSAEQYDKSYTVELSKQT